MFADQLSTHGCTEAASTISAPAAARPPAAEPDASRDDGPWRKADEPMGFGSDAAIRTAYAGE